MVAAQNSAPEVHSATFIRLMKSSLAIFASEMLTGPAQAPYNGRFLVAKHHEIWDGLAKKHNRLCVLAPRDHSKTFFFDFAYPIWKAMREPGSKGYIFSASQPQAERILLDIKNEIETNPKLRHLIPRRKELWSATAIKLANGSRIDARGFGTKVRGAHPDWIVCDDVLNDEDAYSETMRNRHIDYFYTAIVNMIVPGGQIIVVGTPFHANDLYGDLQRNEEYYFVRFQALDEQTGEPLWAARYSKADLEKKKLEIGPIRFTREFQTNPIGDDMSLFPSTLFMGSPIEQPQIKLGMPKDFWDKAGIQLFMGVDFALSSNVRADYTVIWITGADSVGNRWIVDIYRDKGLPYHKQLSIMNAMGQKYEPALVYVEANQAQRIFGDELIRTTDLPVKLFHTGSQKQTLDKGIPSLRIQLENQKWRIPRGDANSVELTDLWVSEMNAFTWVDGKLTNVGAHDDMAMASWITDQAVRQGAFSFSFDDEVDDNMNLDQFLQTQMGDVTEEVVEMAKEAKRIGGVDKSVYNRLIGDAEDFNGPEGGGAPSPDLVKMWYS